MNPATNVVPLHPPETSFDTFWKCFPRKIGKLAALKAWNKAVTMATPEEIIAGVEQYKQHKPEYADWCHPSTWLNGQRWTDEWDEAPQKPRLSPNIEAMQNQTALTRVEDRIKYLRGQFPLTNPALQKEWQELKQERTNLLAKLGFKA